MIRDYLTASRRFEGGAGGLPGGLMTVAATKSHRSA